jgi:hypothetical protein
MKKLLYVIPLAILLLSLTIIFVGAAMDEDDPKLCVEGKWLLVDAADVPAVKVTVPEDARYGNQQQGGCKTPGPDVPMIQVVKERGEHHIMRVWVDGKHASTPTVRFSYGDVVKVERNNGRGAMNVWFLVR